MLVGLAKIWTERPLHWPQQPPDGIDEMAAALALNSPVQGAPIEALSKSVLVGAMHRMLVISRALCGDRLLSAKY